MASSNIYVLLMSTRNNALAITGFNKQVSVTMNSSRYDAFAAVYGLQCPNCGHHDVWTYVVAAGLSLVPSSQLDNMNKVRSICSSEVHEAYARTPLSALIGKFLPERCNDWRLSD